MKRRGFLGLLGGAAVAGPSMAKEAVVGTMADLKLDGVGDPSGFGLPGTATTMSGYVSELDDMRRRLSRLIGQSASDLMRQQRETPVHMLDADLARCRSFSLDFKIREQQRRNFERTMAQERSWIERRISEIMEGE